MIALRPLTYDDLREIPDDGMRREIIGGELIVHPAPTTGHQRVAGYLYRLICAYADEHGGEAFFASVDVLLGRFNVVQPDLIFLSAEQPRVPSEQQAIERAPDLVVEVLSPSTKGTDRVRKMALYASSGIREYWIADPDPRTLVIHVLDDEEYVAVQPDADGSIASRQLPGLRVDPAAVFAGLN